MLPCRAWTASLAQRLHGADRWDDAPRTEAATAPDLPSRTPPKIRPRSALDLRDSTPDQRIQEPNMRNTRPLCTVDPCFIPKRHLDSCEDRDPCRGCLPGLAADGLRLCTHHADRIARDALTLAARHRQLALGLAGTGQPGERTSGGNRSEERR